MNGLTTVPPGVKFVPNAITVLALCSGLTSINFAMRHQWLLAAAMIATAAVLDSLDGPAARLLNSQSRVGAELDSLSDAVSFGIAPAVVMFIFALDRNPVGWLFCLVYAVCTTLRLARFNSALDEEDEAAWSKLFFTGVPSPAGALLAIQPMLFYVRFQDGWWNNPWVVALWMVFVGGLMISKLPSIALKHVFIPSKLVLPALVGFVIAVALAFYEPEVMLGLGLAVYLAHLPYAAWKRKRLERNPELFRDPKRLRAIARARRNNRMRPRIAGRLPTRVRVAGRDRQGRPIVRRSARSDDTSVAERSVNRRLGLRRRPPSR